MVCEAGASLLDEGFIADPEDVIFHGNALMCAAILNRDSILREILQDLKTDIIELMESQVKIF